LIEQFSARIVPASSSGEVTAFQRVTAFTTYANTAHFERMVWRNAQ
jgi:hypothetical protein